MTHPVKHAPPSLNENVFEVPAEFEEDVRQARSALMAGRVAAEAAREIALSTHENPMLTEPAQHRSVKLAVAKASSSAIEKFDRTVASLTARIAAIDKMLEGPTSPASGLLQTEIRTSLFNLNREERRKLILANLNDRAVMGAVLRAPAFLSGISPEEQADFRRQWAQANHPMEVARREHIARALSAAESGGQLLLSYTLSLYSSHVVERGEAAERRAAEAGRTASSAAVH
jgi:hypothetical protein